jgi:hypothetical protein
MEAFMNIRLISCIIAFSCISLFADNWTTSTGGIIYSGSTTKVGVGTSSPTNQLVVKTSTGGDGIALRKGEDNGLRGLLGRAGGGYGFLELYDNSSTMKIKLYSGADSYINNTGNLGIGTTATPAAKLDVAGTGRFSNSVTISSGDLIVSNGSVRIKTWALEAPDYVFEKDYNLPSLKEVEKHVTAEKHLPGIPSAKEMKNNGMDLTEMNMLLLKKVEELTLYTIQLNNKIEQLQKKAAEK